MGGWQHAARSSLDDAMGVELAGEQRRSEPVEQLQREGKSKRTQEPAGGDIESLRCSTMYYRSAKHSKSLAISEKGEEAGLEAQVGDGRCRRRLWLAGGLPA